MADLVVRNGAGRLLGDLFGFDPYRGNATGGYGVEIAKNENGYTVELAVPGVRPEEIDVTLEDRVLTIASTNERRRFTRALLVPDDIDAERIGAHVENGLLSITLALHAKAQPRKIEVKTAV